MVAQLLAGVVIPLLHARMPATLGAHVERQGRPTHAAHDDAGCATCAVQHLADRVERPAPAPPFAREPERPDPARAASMVPARVAFAKSPRAPPLPV